MWNQGSSNTSREIAAEAIVIRLCASALDRWLVIAVLIEVWGLKISSAAKLETGITGNT